MVLIVYWEHVSCALNQKKKKTLSHDNYDFLMYNYSLQYYSSRVVVAACCLCSLYFPLQLRWGKKIEVVLQFTGNNPLDFKRKYDRQFKRKFLVAACCTCILSLLRAHYSFIPKSCFIRFFIKNIF
jgi:hypothetical protein